MISFSNSCDCPRGYSVVQYSTVAGIQTIVHLLTRLDAHGNLNIHLFPLLPLLHTTLSPQDRLPDSPTFHISHAIPVPNYCTDNGAKGSPRPIHTAAVAGLISRTLRCGGLSQIVRALRNTTTVQYLTNTTVHSEFPRRMNEDTSLLVSETATVDIRTEEMENMKHLCAKSRAANRRVLAQASQHTSRGGRNRRYEEVLRCAMLCCATTSFAAL